MDLSHSIIKAHEEEIKKILDEASDGLSETEVRQIGYCLDNIKDCYEIKKLRQDVEGSM